MRISLQNDFSIYFYLHFRISYVCLILNTRVVYASATVRVIMRFDSVLAMRRADRREAQGEMIRRISIVRRVPVRLQNNIFYLKRRAAARLRQLNEIHLIFTFNAFSMAYFNSRGRV